MIGHRANVGPCFLSLALALAACNPLHTIGSEDTDAGPDAGIDAGSDAGSDAGRVAGCNEDGGGCGCGFACGFSDDVRGETCLPQSPTCGVDGGPPTCRDGGVCLAPIVSGAACPVSRCFAAVGVASCTSDSDCPCGDSCAAADGGGGVCSTFATCNSGLDCGFADCVEVYRNGALCPGIRQCLFE